MSQQINYYEVMYSDGIKQLDLICASNLKEAKKIASKRDRIKRYPTAHYMVRRCYNGGKRATMSNWH